MELEFKLKGFDEIRRTMEELPHRIARKVLAGGVRESAKVFVAPMKTAAPVRKGVSGFKTTSWKKMRKTGAMYRSPGFLRRQIKAKMLKRRRAGRPSTTQTQVVYGVGGFGYAFYGFIVAKKYNDFMTPTFTAFQQQALSVMKRGMESGILKEGEKMGFKKSYGWSFP